MPDHPTLTPAQVRALRALELISPATYSALLLVAPGCKTATLAVLEDADMVVEMKDVFHMIPHWVITPAGRRWLAEHDHDG